MPSKSWNCCRQQSRSAPEIKMFHIRPMESTAMPERPPLLIIDENIASSEHEFLVVEPSHERLWSKALQPASKRRTHWTQAQHRRQQPRQQDQVSLDRQRNPLVPPSSWETVWIPPSLRSARRLPNRAQKYCCRFQRQRSQQKNDAIRYRTHSHSLI